ncbi:hypothetical protein INT48_008805 [Thamnidium elegans]|uniref:Uncharacterized protein n=1 Tax=Thamnidium elegans TaxID=101142 RepID=A0A8H7SNM7_9FUNG|nr:hypothetical protein INT48_008805 [Thamnidium elegans]
MDIGNYPIYSNTDKPQKSRSFDGVPEPKNPWDQIGDYDQGPVTGNTNDDDEEDDKKQAQPEPPKKIATQKEKQESDDAASIASQAAVKESNKNQS